MTLEEHRAKIEAMRAAETRLRAWLKQTSAHPNAYPEPEGGVAAADVRLMLERIDAYEASTTWHTDCLNCPKLYDQLYAATEQEASTKAVVDAARELVDNHFDPVFGIIIDYDEHEGVHAVLRVAKLWEALNAKLREALSGGH